MELLTKANGRWHGILSELGIAPTFLRNRNGPCPGCGGTDRFRWDDKAGDGTFFCNGGGDSQAGTGLGLVAHTFDVSIADAAKMVDEVLGGVSSKHEIPKRPPPTPKPKSDLFKRIWAATKPDELTSWDKQVADHPYAELKGITHACGAARGNVSGRVVGKDADCLIVPLRTLSGHLVGVEVIGCPQWDDTRKKRVTPKQTFGAKGALILGNTHDKESPVYVVEGWADAASVWAVMGDVVIVIAFGNADRQMDIAKQIDRKNPDRKIIILEDA